MTRTRDGRGTNSQLRGPRLPATPPKLSKRAGQLVFVMPNKRALSDDAYAEFKKARISIASLIDKQAELKLIGPKATSEQLIELESVQLKLESERCAAIAFAAVIAKDSEVGENSKLFTNADQGFIEKVTKTKLTLKDWVVEEDTSVVPSDVLRQIFQKIGDVVSIYKEAGRRFFLNEFLVDVVSREQFRNALGIHPEYEFSVRAFSDAGEQSQLSGVADYAIGRSERTSRLSGKDPQKEFHLIVAEAKRDWPNESFWQCVAQTAALYKARKDARKRVCKVWGILSNAELWRFIHIDESGQLHATKPLYLNIGAYDEREVLTIYRHIYHIVQAAFDASPPPSPEGPDRARSSVKAGK